MAVSLRERNAGGKRIDESHSVDLATILKVLRVDNRDSVLDGRRPNECVPEREAVSRHGIKRPEGERGNNGHNFAGRRQLTQNDCELIGGRTTLRFGLIMTEQNSLRT